MHMPSARTEWCRKVCQLPLCSSASHARNAVQHPHPLYATRVGRAKDARQHELDDPNSYKQRQESVNDVIDEEERRAPERVVAPEAEAEIEQRRPVAILVACVPSVDQRKQDAKRQTSKNQLDPVEADDGLRDHTEHAPDSNSVDDRVPHARISLGERQNLAR